MEKPIAQGSLQLDRSLGLFTGIMLVAGFMIGTGVFKKIVPMAQSGLTAGEILLAWVAAGIVSYLGSSIVIDLSSLTDKSGGTYEYLRICFGRPIAFLFGWTDFTIIGSASIAALGFVLAQSIHAFIPLPNPFYALSHLNIAGVIYPFADGGIKLLAIAAIWLFAFINYRGVRKAGFLNNIFSIVKILGILLLIAGGLFFSNAHQDSGPIVASTNTQLSFFSAFLAAMLSALWAYDGWMNITFVTGELKNPQRNIPLAILGGLGLVMLLYLLVNYAYIRAIPVTGLAAIGQNQIGATVVAETVFGTVGKSIMTFLLLVSVSGATHAILLAHSRISFRMAEEKNFFRKAALIHPKYRTPHYAIFYVAAWSSLLVISGTFDMLTDMVIFAGFMFYSILVAGLFKMKKQGRLSRRPFGFPFVQIFMVLFSLALIVNTFIVLPTPSIIGALIIISGIPFYYFFNARYNKP